MLCVALRVNSSEISGVPERRQGARRRTLALDRRFQRQAVRRCSGHADGIAKGRAGHAAGRYFDAADDVAAAVDDGDLDPELARGDQFVGDPVNGWLVDAEGLAAGEDIRPRA